MWPNVKTETEFAYVCCHCEPDDRLDSNALFLIRKVCRSHGECWHRRMMVGPDGQKKLAAPVRRNVSPASPQ